MDSYLKKAGLSGFESEIRVEGRRALMFSTAEKASLAVVDRGNVWVIKASGPEPAETLREVIPRLQFAKSISYSESSL